MATYSVALVAFVVLGWFSFARAGVTTTTASLVTLTLAAGSIVLTQLFISAEFQRMAWVGGARIGLLSAFRTSTLASIMNLLPLPGSVAVRVVRLRQEGVSGRRIGVAVAATGLLSLIVAGLAVVPVLLERSVGVVVAVVLFLALSRLAVVIERRHLLRRGSLLGLVLVQVPLIGLDATRLWLVARSLGLEISAEASLILVLAPVLSTAVGVVPGGLGVREGIAALLASAVGLPVEAAIAVSAADTVIRALGLLLCGPVLLRGRRKLQLHREADLQYATS